MTQIDSNSEIAVGIIAGGLAKRYGSQKLYARFGDKSLIEIAINTAKMISDEVILLTGKERPVDLMDLVAYRDIFPGIGPIGGIHTALKKSKKKWVAIMPGDMPFLIPEIYAILFNNRKEDKPVVAISEKGIEPLISIWPISVLPLVEKLILDKEYKLQNILTLLEAEKTEVLGSGKNVQKKNFININTISDYNDLLDTYLT